MTPAQERWAEALAVIRMHKGGTEAFIAERIEAMGNDPGGLRRWHQIRRYVAIVRDAAASDAQ